MIAEQETSVKIESPKEKVVREKQEERRSRLARSPMRSPMPVRRIGFEREKSSRKAIAACKKPSACTQDL